MGTRGIYEMSENCPKLLIEFVRLSLKLIEEVVINE